MQIEGSYQKNEKAARFKFLNIESLINSIETWENNPDNFDSGLYAYLNRITLLSRDDMEDANLKGKVNLMTIHASKGLEFPIVFIAGAEEGIIPHARCIEEDPNNIEEEKQIRRPTLPDFNMHHKGTVIKTELKISTYDSA